MSKPCRSNNLEHVNCVAYPRYTPCTINNGKILLKKTKNRDHLETNFASTLVTKRKRISLFAKYEIKTIGSVTVAIQLTKPSASNWRSRSVKTQAERKSVATVDRTHFFLSHHIRSLVTFGSKRLAQVQSCNGVPCVRQDSASIQFNGRFRAEPATLSLLGSQTREIRENTLLACDVCQTMEPSSRTQSLLFQRRK